MTTTDRKASYLVWFLLLAVAALLSATRFASSAAPESDVPQPPAKPSASGTGQLGKAPPQADSNRTISLHGKVLGPDGRPVAGAHLYLNVDEWTDPALLGTSDKDGSYRFAVAEKKLRRLVTGSWLDKSEAALLVTAAGLGSGWEELPDVNGGRYGAMKSEYAHDFHLPADFPIAGRVVGAGGKPVVGAVVSVDRIHSLSDGLWWKMHRAIKADDVNFMSREETDVNRWFTPLYRTAWKIIPPATTDAEGRFRITGVGGDRAIVLKVTGPGIRSDDVSVLTRDDVAAFTQAIRTKYPRTRRPKGYFYPARASAPEGTQGVLLFGPSPTIEVDPARTLVGVVRDASTGEPVAGARVQTLTSYGDATTDRHGRYRILRMEDEPFIFVRVTPRDHDRYLSVVRRFDNAKGLGEITADFELPRGVVVTGRVLEADTGRPIISAPHSDCHVSWPGPLQTGCVHYYPLAENYGLRGTPAGLYFQGFPAGYLWAEIQSDGRFRMAVPPGLGVLLIQSTPGLPFGVTMGEICKEKDGLHRLFPYATLSARAQNDGGSGYDDHSLYGFASSIRIGSEGTTYHAYRVIDPPADAKTLDLKFTVRRGASRVVRFVGPDGRALRGVRVWGLVQAGLNVALDGSETEVIGLTPGKPRQVIAYSSDGKFSAKTFVSTTDPQPKTIKLQPAGSVTGRIVDENGKPLEAILVPSRGPIRTDAADEEGVIPETRCDAEGRFRIGPLLPWQRYTARIFRDSRITDKAFEDLVIRPGEVRDLGDIRVRPSADAKSGTKAGK